MSQLLSIRAPDHFGDGVMALAAVAGLGGCAATLGVRAWVHAPPWGTELYGWLPGVEVVARDVTPRQGSTGVLLKPSFGAAWRWRNLPERVGIAGNGRGWLLTGAIRDVPGEHRRQGYARVAGALGASVPVDARPSFAPRAPWEAWSPGPGFVALNAWGRTPSTRWPFMSALADLLVREGRAVVFLAGPEEGNPVRALASGHPVLEHRELAPLASLLRSAALVVSHDSGLAHFAEACGASVLVVHGPTDPRVTGAGIGVSAVPRPGGGGRMSGLSLTRVHDAVQAALAPTG